MTMRTTTNFVCLNGHEGVRETAENDQPYSTDWRSVELKGMREGKDEQGRKIFKCSTCGLPMERVGDS